MEQKQIDEEILDKLYGLLSQDQFELLPPFDTGRIRLVYLMNDAVESFLVFEEAVLTGFYDEHYEGELEAELRCEEDGRYVLLVHQGKTFCTIFFRDLSLDVHLYNYGKTGHAWMKGHEELRQIEYWIAIMKAKRDYLGEEYCNEMEKQLTALEEFPPLNVCSFPAVPRQYYEPREDAWEPTEAGIQTMQYWAEQAGDRKLLQVLEQYKEQHGQRETKRIARLLCSNRHSFVVDLLIQKIMEASEEYPERIFATDEERTYEVVKREAKQRMAMLQAEGKTVYMVCQMPFVEAKDEVEFKVHLLVLSKGLRKRKVVVETFC